MTVAKATEFLDKRLVFVTGKGGVGKSVVSSSIAQSFANRGERTLWVEMTESAKGGYLFTSYEADYDPKPISDHLVGMNLRFQPAIEEYLEIVFKIPILSKRIARNTLFRVFTTALPGLDALVTTGKIWYEEERLYRGTPYWDRIVVDAPATGHGLSLLRFPRAALDIVQSGPIADRARDIDRMLGNRSETAIVVVSLLEELPVDEGLELIDNIHNDTSYQVAGIIANSEYPQIGQSDESKYRQWLAGSIKLKLDAISEANARERLTWMDHWATEQKRLLPRLQNADLPLLRLPWIPAATEQELVKSMALLLESGTSL